MSEQRGPILVTWRRRLIDPLLFSSVWMALAAGALTIAASGAMQIPVSPAAPGLVFFGILLVYNLDRLRDVERDRATSPERSRFIASHRRGLWALTVSSAAGASCILLTAPTRVWIIALGALGLGFGHRRLKQLPYLKESYLTAAWLAGIVLGIGVCLLAPAPVRPLLAVSLLTGASLFAFRPGELYGFLVIDGALLAGGVAAWALA